MVWQRLVGAVSLLALVGAALYYGFSPSPVLVDSAKVTRGPLQVTVEQEGKTRVVDRYIIASPVAGRLRRIELDVGDAVVQDQVVATLIPAVSAVLDARSRATAQAQLEVARASLRAAEERVQAAAADAEFAEGELVRLRNLQASGAESVERLQLTEANARRTAAQHRSAKFAVDVAKFEVKVAEAALQSYASESEEAYGNRVTLHSPVSGRVLKLFRESETTVRAGENLIELGDPSTLEVEVDVLSADAVRIQPNSRVLLTRWGGQEPLEARVQRIEPTAFTKISALGVEEQRVLTICDITSKTAEREKLGDGYRVEAAFVLWESDDVLQVPSGALFRHQGEWAVFAVDTDNRAARRKVGIDHRSALAAEVVEGLQEGDVVVLHPDRDIEDGVLLEIHGRPTR